MASTLVHIAYPVTSVVVFLFGCFAFIVGWLHFRKRGYDTQEFFLTARNSASIFRVSFSFFAGVMGSWAMKPVAEMLRRKGVWRECSVVKIAASTAANAPLRNGENWFEAVANNG